MSSRDQATSFPAGHDRDGGHAVGRLRDAAPAAPTLQRRPSRPRRRSRPLRPQPLGRSAAGPARQAPRRRASPAASPAAAASPSPAAAAQSAPAAQAAPASKPTQTFEVATQLGWLRNGEFAPDHGRGRQRVLRGRGDQAPHPGWRARQEPGPDRRGRPGRLRHHGRRQLGVPGAARPRSGRRHARSGRCSRSAPYAYITIANPTRPRPEAEGLEGKTFGHAAGRRLLSSRRSARRTAWT